VGQAGFEDVEICSEVEALLAAEPELVAAGSEVQ
jgi:hypothetical protein